MYKFQSIGQDIQALPVSNPYCENLLPNMCVQEQRVLDKAQQDCWKQGLRSQTKGLFGSLGKTCTLYASDAMVSMSHYNMWDPCMLAKLPLCGGTPTTTTTFVDTPTPVTTTTPPPEDSDVPESSGEEEDDGGQYVIGGILGLLVLGGIGYAVFKSRKKKGKRR